MLDQARQAAALWGLGTAPIELAARRENVVFRVAAPSGDLALRFHRPGYRDKAQLTSELEWTAALALGGLSVPAPIAAQNGALIQQHGEHFVDMLEWLPGAPLGKAGELQGVEDRVGFCRRLGAAMAELHRISDEWGQPTGFSRPSWDRNGLLGEAPLWGRFWEHPDLGSKDRAMLEKLRVLAGKALADIEETADYGLIHADLLSENMLFDGRHLSFIDFDDGGFGFRDFELATFLLRYENAPDYADLCIALCAGYARRREVAQDVLDLMLLLRALTYPGWIMERLDEPRGQERSDRAIHTAMSQARRWLVKYGGGL